MVHLIAGLGAVEVYMFGRVVPLDDCFYVLDNQQLDRITKHWA